VDYEFASRLRGFAHDYAPSCFHSASRILLEARLCKQGVRKSLIYCEELVAGTGNHRQLTPMMVLC
jgi:hypothetical protein